MLGIVLSVECGVWSLEFGVIVSLARRIENYKLKTENSLNSHPQLLT